MMKRFLRYTLGVLIFILLISHVIQAAVLPHEREALVALYNSTDGDSWNNNSMEKAAGCKKLNTPYKNRQLPSYLSSYLYRYYINYLLSLGTPIHLGVRFI